MAGATSLTPPSPGMSAIRFQNETVEPYSRKRPEKVNITTLYRCMGDFLGLPQGTTTSVVISK